MAGTSTWTYDSATGQQLTQTTAGSSTVTYTYYAANHANAGQVASMSANGEVTRYAYDAQGRRTHQWGTGSQPLKYVCDGLGRLHELHTYQGGSGWDSSTLPATFGSATAAVTTWDYHPGTSALWKKTDAASEFVAYAYDSAHSGLLAVKTNARGITTTYAHAVASGGKKLPGMVTGVDYSDSTPDVAMSYVRGQLTTVTDAAGLSTLATSGATRTTTVTGSGLMTDLVVTRTEFGPDMPETVQAQVGGSTVALNQHQWNANGTLAKAWQGDRSTGSGGSGIRHVWSRNATSGRLEGIGTEAFGSGATHGVARGYTHTAGGRVEKVWYNAGTLGTPSTSVQGFDYAHDTHGRREVVSPYLPDNAPAAADQPPGWKYGYNERGEVTVADRFTAAGGPSTGVVTHQRRSYDYDLMGNRNTATQGTNIGELKETGYTANILQQYDGLTHTRQVEITGQAVAGATVELTLDGGTPITVNRSLPEHQTGDPDSFRYVHTVGGTDARWLHVSIKASLGGIDITRAGFTYVPPSSESLTYDEDGNLTATAEWDYTWDAENRLIGAEQKSLPVAGGLTAPARKKLEFDYDYKNRRISKRVYQSSGGGWSLTKDLRFVYDGWQMIAELDHTFATGTALAGSAVNRTFLWGPDLSGSMTGAGGVGGLLSTTYQGITYQACSDANGNVTGLVPVSGPGAGTLVARFDYDPFGNRVTNAGPNVELCPFGFSSKYLDTESEVVSYELRGYLPGMGRWLSRDPIGEEGGLNLYGMVGNDPVNHFDVLGMGKGKIIGYMAKRFGQQSVKKVTPIFTHKEAAQLFKKGSELIMKSRDDALKVARIAIDKKNLLRHKGHKLKTGKTGAPHYQDNTASGKHIFWSTVLAGISASTASNLQGADTGDQAGVELVEVYTDPYPGPSIANGLTATYWFGQDSVMSYLDWINPGELIAMGGDYGRELSREQEKELIGFSLTISECGKPAWTFGFDTNGKLISSSEWVDGKLQEQQITSFGDTIWLDVKETAK